MRKVFYFMSALTVFFLCSLAWADVNDSGVKVPWSYTGHIGPEFWGRLSPYFLLCSTGRSQSPIDISKNQMEVSNTLELHYQTEPLILEDNGDTQLTIGHEQMILNDGHTIQVNTDNSVKEYISYLGQPYQLIQFHFHSPSETQLNGESAPLEIHFVHQGERGAVLVIGVLVKSGNPNLALQSIIDHLPPRDGKPHLIKGERINLQDFFPLDNDYYSYQGSLTTPPCTEGIQWVVMASEITASPPQIALLRKAIGGSNARAVQSLNDRVITYSPGRVS